MSSGGRIRATAAARWLRSPQAGRELVQRATADLMKAEFGMAGYGEAQLDELFAMLRGLRVTAGDFTES